MRTPAPQRMARLAGTLFFLAAVGASAEPVAISDGRFTRLIYDPLSGLVDWQIAGTDHLVNQSFWLGIQKDLNTPGNVVRFGAYQGTSGASGGIEQTGITADGNRLVVNYSATNAGSTNCTNPVFACEAGGLLAISVTYELQETANTSALLVVTADVRGIGISGGGATTLLNYSDFDLNTDPTNNQAFYVGGRFYQYDRFAGTYLQVDPGVNVNPSPDDPYGFRWSVGHPDDMALDWSDGITDNFNFDSLTDNAQCDFTSQAECRDYYRNTNTDSAMLFGYRANGIGDISQTYTYAVNFGFSSIVAEPGSTALLALTALLAAGLAAGAGKGRPGKAAPHAKRGSAERAFG